MLTCDQIPNNKTIERHDTVITGVGECDSNFKNNSTSPVNGVNFGVGKEYGVISGCDNSEHRMSALKQKKSGPLRIEDAKSGKDSKEDKDEKELQRASKVSESFFSSFFFIFGSVS